jgi:hypothetical protein
VINALESMLADTAAFDAATRATATSIHRFCSDRDFVVQLYFMADVLIALNRFSKIFQKRAGIILGHEGSINQLILTMDNLKAQNGEHLVSFFSSENLVLSDATGRTHKTSALYYSSKSVKFHGKELKQSERGRQGALLDTNDKLASNRRVILNQIIDQLQKYFPDQDITKFTVFNPRHFPPNVGGFNTFGLEEVTQFAKMFGLPHEDTMREWIDLMMKIASRADYCEHTTDEPISFWSYYFSKNDLPWSTNIKYLLESILTIPLGSADCERGFAALNLLTHRGTFRNRLETESLNNLMRIKINGPDVPHFDAAKYARSWIETKGMRTDDPHNKKSLSRKRKYSESDDEIDEDMPNVHLTKLNIF